FRSAQKVTVYVPVFFSVRPWSTVVAPWPPPVASPGSPTTFSAQVSVAGGVTLTPVSVPSPEKHVAVWSSGETVRTQSTVFVTAVPPELNTHASTSSADPDAFVAVVFGDVPQASLRG